MIVRTHNDIYNAIERNIQNHKISYLAVLHYTQGAYITFTISALRRSQGDLKIMHTVYLLEMWLQEVPQADFLIPKRVYSMIKA